MPFDGNGNWTSNFNAEADRDAGYKILASRFDNILLADIAQSFENCLTKDTQIKPQTNFNANNYRIINLANPEDDNDALTYGKFRTGNNTLTGNNTFSGNSTFSGSNKFTGGVEINSVDGGVELKPSNSTTVGGFIDFHFAGPNADYTSRIIEDANGQLRASCSRLMVPDSSTVGSAISTSAISKSTNGYVKLGNGIIIQWGRFSTSSYTQTGTITFPTAFSNTNYSLAFGSFRNGQTGLGQGYFLVTNNTSSNFTYKLVSGSDNYASQGRWIAIGY
jgi:hypothetical protein